ncbi:MAG: glutamine--fructose-6-phosphate transaminase (isomerizing) [Lachnospiraceae bacterium]|nr:glutamine--fructose-6-phosphate transaminase (isomerizing) [Lachnospiraceae bacterium]
MCGIVGYIGKEEAAPILLDGLSKLEYRGYDSAGMAVLNDDEIFMTKSKGKLEVLNQLTHGGETLKGHLGIGHTRWATHGEPSDLNSHPHLNANGTIAVVHNGIIENYAKLKEKLIKKGYEFKSETDTEVIAQMLDYYYNGDPLCTIATVMQRIEGSYALGVIFKDTPDVLYAVRKDSPLIVGHTDGGSIIASDVPAVLKYTRDVIFIENEEIVTLKDNEIKIFNIDREELDKPVKHIDWDADAAEKGGYEFFMLKEINEQPKAIKDTFSPRIKDGKIVIEELLMSEEEIRNIKRICFVACGSAYHTAVTSKYIFEGLARIPVDVEVASEFRYRDPIIEENTLVIVVSQSGETADTLAALRLSKEKGAKTLGIVNVVGSSIAREADMVMYTWAGPEISVATTKAYSAQLIAEYLLAMHFANVKGNLSDECLEEMIEDLKALPEQVELLVNNRKRVQRFANRYLAAKDVFFIGRNVDYAISMEGSLKLKEISYIHSEAYAAGELKHGTISLIEEGTLVVAVATQEEVYGKTKSNIVEVKTRGAVVMSVAVEGNSDIEDVSDYVIYIPETNKYFMNSLAVIPLQLFGYYISLGKGYDVDKPRNLAKSVTVE